MMKAYLVIILTSLIFNCYATVYIEKQTVYGRVQGYEKEVLPGRTVQIFLGVPYAEKPLGDLRFEYPQEPSRWSGILNTTSLPPACPQYYFRYIQEHFPGWALSDEDCLYLNIYVPKDLREELSPVFVYIHGGSNEMGMGAMLSGEVLAAYTNVVVVNFNYRLETLGFLSLEDENIPGNFGLADQVAVLKWVQNNIHYFGGDRARVTLGGHSAGSLDTLVLSLSSVTKGLFRFAIALSGSPLSYWSTLTDNIRVKYRTRVLEFLDNIGCGLELNTTRIKNCLRTKSAHDIVYKRVRKIHYLLVQHPLVIDKYLYSRDAREMILRGYSHVDAVLMGFTKDEGSKIAISLWKLHDFSFDRDKLEKFAKYIQLIYPNIYGPTDIVLQEYMNWTDPDNEKSLLQVCSYIDGDFAITAPMVETADKLTTPPVNSKRRPKVVDNLYLYSFEFSYEYSEHKWLLGVPHGLDIFYLFGQPIVGHPKYNFTQDDIQMSKYMMEMWGNFIKDGYPSVTLDGKQRTFKPYDPHNRSYIKISKSEPGSTSAVSTDNHHHYKPDKMHLWNELLPFLNTERTNSHAETMRTKCEQRNSAGRYAVSKLLITCVVCILLQGLKIMDALCT